MKIKKYKAATMREALLQVKADLGPDAVILKIHEPKNMLGKSEGVEVTAALDEAQQPAPEVPPVMTEFAEIEKKSAAAYDRRGVKTVAWRQVDAQKNGSVGTEPQGLSGKVEKTMQEVLGLRQELQALREEIKNGVRKAAEGMPSGFQRLADGLEKSGLSVPVIQDILAEVMIRCPAEERSSARLLQVTRETIAARIPIAPEFPRFAHRAAVLLFVGPTGAGKTTTIAKLVGREILRGNRSVGIVTTDCYRIGALEQMEVFSRTAEVALETVFGVEDVAPALERLKGCSLIFVDTAGRSRANREHLEELRALADAIHPDMTYLTLSLNMRNRDMSETVELFRSMGINRLLFTKQDETYELGALLWLPAQSGISVSHVCTGQRIPDDIADASAMEMAGWILGEVSV